MEELTLERADASTLAMRQALRDEPELSEMLSFWEKELRPRFNVLAVGFCFAKYISAELDFRTPGDRGLGRVSTEIPRLGAYFRKPMSRLSQSQLGELYGIIQDLMLRGYLTRAFLAEAPPKQSVVTTPSELYETWLAGFYSSDPSQMGPNLRAMLAAVTDSAFAALNAFFNGHGMRGGGLFREDKTGLITLYYPLGGFAVRTFEVGGSR